MNDHNTTITRVDFRDYKAFPQLTVRLQHMNILVGPNNCGKSTILDAFRTLDIAMRRARTRSPEQIIGPEGRTLGYTLVETSLPMSIENVHTDYEEIPSRVNFRFSNSSQLTLYFPEDGGAHLIPAGNAGEILYAKDFNRAFPTRISVVPVLGPVEHKERIRTLDTVRNGLATHRASRHFRNYWRYFDEGFDQFAALIRRTWSGMDILPPELTDISSQTLQMFCLEDRITRELYWSGFGFQVWCQLLTHISRCRNDSLLIVDEPEIYLHPDIQRQLLGILRDAGPDILLATHSSEIMGEADPSEILHVDKHKKTVERLRDIDSVQAALNAMGSIQNITLTQLARNRRVLFVEAFNDFRILRRFAKRIGLNELASGVGFTPVESGGFSNWERVRSLGWGMEKAIGKALKLGAVFDRDFWPDEQIDEILDDLREHLNFAAIHQRKEIENYLLVPSTLQRALERAVADRTRRQDSTPSTVWAVRDVLAEITEPKHSSIQGQYIARRASYFKSTKEDPANIATTAIEQLNQKWADIETRMEVVPGKETLAALRQRIQADFSVTLTDYRIIDAFHRDEVPEDIISLLNSLEQFRSEISPT